MNISNETIEDASRRDAPICAGVQSCANEESHHILNDNWQDKKSEQFSSTCVTVVNNTCQEYMQTVEQVQTGINSSLEQLKSMEQELSKELSAPEWAYKG